MIELINDLDENLEVQRYMNFSKFMHLLETSSIYLSKVSNFEDQLEGGLTAWHSAQHNGELAALDMAINGSWPSQNPDQSNEIKQENLNHDFTVDKIKTIFGKFPPDEAENVYRKYREWVDVSCWHANLHESMAKWKIYGESDNAVCLISSAGDIKSSIIDNAGKKILMSRVDYIDHEQEFFTNDHPISTLTHKSYFYKYEDEVRLLAYDPNSDISNDRPDDQGGTLLKFDLDKLIGEIRVSHLAPDWFFNLVKSVVNDTYKIDVRVSRSHMSQEPITK